MSLGHAHPQFNTTFICGPAGSGKSYYLNQLTSCLHVSIWNLTSLNTITSRYNNEKNIVLNDVDDDAMVLPFNVLELYNHVRQHIHSNKLQANLYFVSVKSPSYWNDKATNNSHMKTFLGTVRYMEFTPLASHEIWDAHVHPWQILFR